MDASNIINNITINKQVIIHNGEYKKDDTNKSYDFGVLKIKIDEKCEYVNQSEKLLILTIDHSGSMSDNCADGRTKMKHIIHTLENIIRYFGVTPELPKVSIIVIIFDNDCKVLIEKTLITNDNYKQLIEKVHDISPETSTNFEKPLLTVKDIVTNSKNKKEYEPSQITHIFMTDGEVNDGKFELEHLMSFLDNEISNTFIGFGLEHDANLLNKMSNIKNGNYYFIDKLENSGLVYGEITHEIIYKVFDNMEIEMEGKEVEIYDWKSNEWSSLLVLDKLVKEKELIYQIRISKEGELKNVCINFDNPLINTTQNLQINEEKEDLMKYIFRQKTQELLYQANTINKKNKNQHDIIYKSIFDLVDENKKQETIFDMENVNKTVIYTSNQEDIESSINTKKNVVLTKKLVKRNIANLFKEIKDYMKEKNMETDTLLKLLCDDLYVVFRTFDQQNSEMYCTSRLYSQGKQRVYNVTTVDTNTNCNTVPLYRSTPRKYNKLVRQRNITPYYNHNTLIDNDNDEKTIVFDMDNNTEINYDYINEDDEYETNIIQHDTSQFTDSPYLSPTSLNVMRSISASVNDYDDYVCDYENMKNDLEITELESSISSKEEIIEL